MATNAATYTTAEWLIWADRWNVKYIYAGKGQKVILDMKIWVVNRECAPMCVCNMCNSAVLQSETCTL